jgi:hypothetical protein
MKFVRTYFEIMDLLESIINTEDADEKDVVLATMAKSMIASRLISQNKPFELRKYAENIVIQTDGKSYVFDEETMRAMDQLLSVDQEEKQEEKPVDTIQNQEHSTQETTEEKEDKQKEASDESKQDEEVNIPQQAVSEHPLTQDETNEAEDEVNNETFNPGETEYEPDMPTFTSEDNDPFSSDSSANALMSDGLNYDEPSYNDPASSNGNEAEDTSVKNETVLKNVLLHPERMDIKIKQKDIMYAYVKGNFTDENGEPLSRVDMFVTPLTTSINKPEFIVRYVIDRNADKQLMADALGESPEAIIDDGKGNSLKVTCSISEGVLQPMVEGVNGSEFVIAAIKDEGLSGKGHLEAFDPATGISVRMFPSGKKNEANGHAKFAYCVFKHDQLVDIGYSTGEPILVNNNGEMLKFACKWDETDNPSENVAEVEMFDYGRKQ